MNTFGTDPRARRGWPGARRAGRAVALFAASLAFGTAALAEERADKTKFQGSATLGADFYVIENPFDTANVTGFFDQYRYIRDKGAEVPFFADLTHLDLGWVHPDETYLLRLERWSRNAINENSRLGIRFKGLTVDAELRRYRSDALRFFPLGTEDDWAGMPLGLGFGTTYNPDVPGLITGFSSDVGAVFDGNYRIGVERLAFASEIALRPEGFGYDNKVLKQASLRAGYGSRTGNRQDSFLLDLSETLEPTSRFRGNRRAIDQSVTQAGLGAIIALAPGVDATLDFDVDRFRESAPVVTLGGLASAPGNGFTPNPAADSGREFFFVPDTNRYTGSLQVTARRAGAVVSAGAFGTHLEQTGRLSNLQTQYNLGLNSTTTASAHIDASMPLEFEGSNLELSGYVKYLYRKSDTDADAFAALDPVGSSQESPYIEERNELRGNLEIAARPLPSSRIALGYAVDWVDRDLAYPSGNGGIQPDVSVIHPESLSHRIFLKGHARLFRSLQIAGEIGQLWAPKVAYPTDLSEATSFTARGTYTLDRRLVSFPVTLALAARVLDGKNDKFDLPGPGPVSNGERRAKKFERTDWGYDLTLSLVPQNSWVVYATFSQSGDEQDSDYVRTTLARSAGGGAFYVDSIPHYESDLKSLLVGTRLSDLAGVDVAVSAALTWADMLTRGAAGVGSNVGELINVANRIESRILTLNSDADYRVRENLGVGVGYRFQQFVDDAQVSLLDLDETVHTISLRLTADF